MGNTTGLRPWPKGVSGNPSGNAPRLPPEIRAERKKNQAALIKLIILYFSMTEEQAKQRTSGNEANQLEEAVQGMINKAKEGDTNAFKYLTELICGKIPETDAETGPERTPQETLEAMEKAVLVLKEQIGKNGPIPD